MMSSIKLEKSTGTNEQKWSSRWPDSFFWQMWKKQSGNRTNESPTVVEILRALGWLSLFTFVYLEISHRNHKFYTEVCIGPLVRVVGNPLNTTWTLNSLDCIGLVSVLLEWCNYDVMTCVCNAHVFIFPGTKWCQLVWVSLSYTFKHI